MPLLLVVTPAEPEQLPQTGAAPGYGIHCTGHQPAAVACSAPVPVAVTRPLAVKAPAPVPPLVTGTAGQANRNAAGRVGNSYV